ncbi:hypothetical protein ABPG75_010899 [Micractinium tetrahymenae]
MLQRVANERYSHSDERGCKLSARLMLVYIVFGLMLRDRAPGLALAAATHSLLAFCLGWLAANRRRFYARHRELLLAAACLHVTWVSHTLALLGGTNLFAHSRGSPLLLLFATLVQNGGLWVGFYSIFTRLDAGWNRAALPLLALPPLLMTRRLCGRMMEAPGSGMPLRELYTVLEAAHSATIFPAALLPLPLEQGSSAEQQCATVSAWSLLLSAGALPLLVLHWLEKRRQRLLAVHRRQESAAGGPEAAAGLGASLPERPSPEGERRQQALQLRLQEQELHSWRPGPWWLLELYLASCQLWSLAALLRPLLPRW